MIARLIVLAQSAVAAAAAEAVAAMQLVATHLAAGVCLHAQVLVVPLPLKPLFPGGIMPVTVTNNKLIKELFEIRKSG